MTQVREQKCRSREGTRAAIGDRIVMEKATWSPHGVVVAVAETDPAGEICTN